MDGRSLWQRRTVGDEPNPRADQRFREIEAAGENTFALLGLTSSEEVREHPRKLRDRLATELSVTISLDDQVQDAGHLAVLGPVYGFSVSLSRYGKLARVHEPDPSWLPPRRVALVERFVEIVAEAGYEIVPLQHLELPYTGSTFVGGNQPDWGDFFFNYW